PNHRQAEAYRTLSFESEVFMSTNHRRFFSGFFLLALFLITLRVHGQDAMDSWKDFDFSKTAITQSQIHPLALQDLKLLRGIVFGRHGRVFKDADIKFFLEGQSWFKANPSFSNSMLNNTERQNLDLIRIAEASKHETIQPGDMRYWVSRPITAKKLGKHS